jgi:hypothetical protein
MNGGKKRESSKAPHPARGPVLEYRTPVPVTRIYRPPRKPLPAMFCVGWGAASFAILIMWAAMYSNNVRHSALIVVVAVGAAGAALCAVKELRPAGLAVLMVVGIWFLLIGGCFAIGGINQEIF